MMVIGARETAASFVLAAAKAQVLSRECTARNGRAMLAAVVERAPKRTGHYAGTIKLQVSYKAGQATATVYSDHPAAWRLERGFHGVDSRGRSYNEEGRPHFSVGAANVAPKFTAELFRIVLGL